MRNSNFSKLTRARRENLLVSFTRPFERGSFLGYVMDIGPKFFVLAVVDNDVLRFNGFSCLRLVDMRNLRVPHRYSRFIEAAHKNLGERKPKKPRILMSNVQNILLSASECFPLVTIHRERVHPGVCHIGRVEEVSRTSLFIQEIGPDAVWDKEVETYNLGEITRVDFGGAYEKALYVVGGKPN